MTNIVTLQADKRWNAVIEYRTDEGRRASNTISRKYPTCTSSSSTGLTGVY